MQSSESTLRQYLQVLKRQAWLVVLVPCIAIAATLAVIKKQEPIYRASMTIVVGEQHGKLPPNLGDHSLTRTITNLIEGDYVARSVIKRLRLDMTKDDLLKDLKVDVLPDSAVVDIKYESTDRRRAFNVISAIDTIFSRNLDETLGVRTPGTKRRPGSFDLVVRVFDPPHVEPDPLDQNAATKLIFAGAASLALGLLLAVAREALDSRIRTQKEAEEWLGAPVVGVLPRGLGAPPPGVGSARRRDDRRAASLDLLRARLEFAQTGIGGPTILVTGAGPDVDKSSVVANLAAALARGGKRVVCVDADVRRPRLYRSLGLPKDAPGLVEMLDDEIELHEALVRLELVRPGANGATPADGRLEVLPAGKAPAPLVDVITTDVVEDLMRKLHDRADFVIFDSPPLGVADAYPLAVQSDNVLVVARSGRTTKDQAESARATLEELGIERVGVVLTDAPRDGYNT